MVTCHARAKEAETIVDWLGGRKWTQELNDEFISTMKAQGRLIKDIGPNFGRRLKNHINPAEGKPPSLIYGSERRSLSGYEHYECLYERSGKYNL